MCGLFGILSNETLCPEDLHRARLSRDVLAHRGPDHAGEHVDDKLYLGHRRLSIIDTSPAGSQPMIAGNVAITVNGEIYNFRELRADLERLGNKFSSQSDSEVMLHGFRQWGIDGLAERLDGMYAAVIVDKAARQIYALRDRAGIKPFHYYFDGKMLVWASELKAIVAYFGQDRLATDNTAIVDFLTYRYIPSPKTMYRNVFKLPPASILHLMPETGKLSVRRYWELPLAETNRPFPELLEELRTTLALSVEAQLVSDVPLGLLLSGGIDSSAVTALASRAVKQIRSFSVGFEGTSRDETPFAEIVAKQANAVHTVHHVQQMEMDDVVNRLSGWFDEPFGDSSAIPTYRVCAVARQSVTVALSGDGGDELFGGYRWYHRYGRLRSLQRFVPIKRAEGLKVPSSFPGARAMRLLTVEDPIRLWALLRGGLKPQKLSAWKNRLGVDREYDDLWAYRAHFRPDLSPRQCARVMDFHTYLPDDVLTKVDRTSMAVSLECRPPFLSRSMIEFAFSLPESFIYMNGELKGGLKAALKGVLPESILTRGKQGFGVPDFGWKKQLAARHGSFGEAIVEMFLGDRKAAPAVTHTGIKASSLLQENL